MVLRKITFDNSVRCIPKSEQTREIERNTIKNKSTSKKQNENILQNNQISWIMWKHKDLVYLQNGICTIIILVILIFVYG